MKNRRHIHRGLCILCSGVLLALGGMVYVLFRPRVILLFRVIDRMGLGTWVDDQRTRFSGICLPEWMVFCLPNGLWSASYVVLMDALMRERSRRERLAWASVIPLLGASSELLQGFCLLDGTFDPIDMVCYVTPLLVYIALLFLLKP